MKNNNLVNPAKLLLEDLQELYLINPDFKTWDNYIYEKGTYKYYLIKRMYSLLKAMQLKEDFELIFSGSFIMSFQIEIHNVFSKSQLLNKFIPDERSLRWEIFPGDWPPFFKSILNHTLKINSVLAHNSMVIAASGLYRSAVEYTDAISEDIWKIAKDEFNVLEYLLNPNEKMFTIEELNKSYDYPIVDMGKLFYDEF